MNTFATTETIHINEKDILEAMKQIKQRPIKVIATKYIEKDKIYCLNGELFQDGEDRVCMNSEVYEQFFKNDPRVFIDNGLELPTIKRRQRNENN